MADNWYRSTALEDLVGVPIEAVGKDRLYRAHDRVLPLKQEIEKHLKQRFPTLFDTKSDVLLYDVASSYSQSMAEGNPSAP